MKKFEKISFNFSNLVGYIEGESLIILNKKSGTVFGLESRSAAQVFYEDLEYGKSGKLKDDFILKKISTEESNESTYEAPLLQGYLKPILDGLDIEKQFISDRVIFRLSKKSFDINYQKILPIFQLLESSEKIDRDGYIVDVQIEQIDPNLELFQLSLNGKKIYRPLSSNTIPLLLQEHLIISYYQSKHYLMALHAAAVEIEGKAIVMPGLSGSGKSTLCTVMSGLGYPIFSDEIALIDEEGILNSIPFCMNIKEGSWKFVEEFYPKLNDFITYRRFDGQGVKLLAPKYFSYKKIQPSVLVFPKFIPNSNTKIVELNSCSTLKMIKDAGYQLDFPLNEERFELILKYILSKPSFYIEYSNAKEVIDIIKGQLI